MAEQEIWHLRGGLRRSPVNELMEDCIYCSSSFLMHRMIIDRNKCFSKKLPPALYEREDEPIKVKTSEDLYEALRIQVERACADGKAALALSAGIDSAILAKFMPKDSKAYTFKCTVPGIEVNDEAPQAAHYAEECGLDHEVVEITWQDMEELSPLLMKHKGAPIHSIEVQIYKAAAKAKADGFDRLIFGESADSIYGGQSKIFSGNWTFGDYVNRYCYVLPYKVLKSYDMVTDTFIPHIRLDGTIDVHSHFHDDYYRESMGSYANACAVADIELVAPYSNTWLDIPIDYDRIRSGDSKYLVREVFARLYPSWQAPPKTPMPRPTEEWLADWEGPMRSEFWPNCIHGMTGDQKWLLWSLERFLNLLDELS